MRTKLLEMFQIQNNLNKSICGEDYANANIAFHRAAVIEAGELMEHVGYKWWKQIDSYDEAQAHLEIVDIWHFLLSHVISETSYAEATRELLPFIELYFKELKHNKCNKEERLQSVDAFIAGIYNKNSITHSLRQFANMMDAFELSFENLHKWYLGKNALNYFRQEHGYKDGTYNKEDWKSSDGKFVEDNVVLAEILNTNVANFDEIYNELKHKYPN